MLEQFSYMRWFENPESRQGSQKCEIKPSPILWAFSYARPSNREVNRPSENIIHLKSLCVVSNNLTVHLYCSYWLPWNWLHFLYSKYKCELCTKCWAPHRACLNADNIEFPRRTQKPRISRWANILRGEEGKLSTKTLHETFVSLLMTGYTAMSHILMTYPYYSLSLRSITRPPFMLKIIRSNSNLSFPYLEILWATWSQSLATTFLGTNY